MTSATRLPRVGTFPAPALCCTPAKCSAKTSAQPCRSCSGKERVRREYRERGECARTNATLQARADGLLETLNAERNYLHAERAAHAKTRRRRDLWKYGSFIVEILCVVVTASVVLAVRR